MNLVSLYWLYSLLASGLCGWQLQETEGTFTQHTMLALVWASMSYDSFAIAISPHLGPSLLLQQLNRTRFWLHHLTTPLLFVFVITLQIPSGDFSIRANAPALISTLIPHHVFAWAIALVLMLLGCMMEWKQPELTPIHCAGTLRYRSAGFCPLPSIVVTGAIAWWGMHHLEFSPLTLSSLTLSPGFWVLGSAIAVFGVNGIQQDDWKLRLSPAAELALVGSLAAILG